MIRHNAQKKLRRKSIDGRPDIGKLNRQEMMSNLIGRGGLVDGNFLEELVYDSRPEMRNIDSDENLIQIPEKEKKEQL